MGKALKTVGGAIAGGLVGGPAGALIGGSLGASLGQDSAPDISAMARQGGFSGNLYTDAFKMEGTGLTKTPYMMGQLGQFNQRMVDINNERLGLGGIRGDLARMRGEIRPGFGRLTAARTQAIKDAGAESIGNLRESLARRNVLGASFANDAISREQMAVGREVERASAESFVQELGMEMQRMGVELGVAQTSAQMIAQHSSMIANQMDREMQELGLIGNIRNGVNAAINAQAMQMAQLQMLQQGNNQDLMGLMMAGGMGLFGKTGVMQGKSFSNLFGG